MLLSQLDKFRSHGFVVGLQFVVLVAEGLLFVVSCLFVVYCVSSCVAVVLRRVLGYEDRMAKWVTCFVVSDVEPLNVKAGSSVESGS